MLSKGLMKEGAHCYRQKTEKWSNTSEGLQWISTVPITHITHTHKSIKSMVKLCRDVAMQCSWPMHVAIVTSYHTPLSTHLYCVNMNVLYSAIKTHPNTNYLQFCQASRYVKIITNTETTRQQRLQNIPSWLDLIWSSAINHHYDSDNYDPHNWVPHQNGFSILSDNQDTAFLRISYWLNG